MPSRKKSDRQRAVWTDTMISDLLWCKKEAIFITKGENPPRKANGRKIGYMEYMHTLWNQKNYGYLGLTTQNLRDEANQAESKHESFQTSLTNTILDDRVSSNYTVNVNTVNDTTPEVGSNTFIVCNDKVSEITKEADTIFNKIKAKVGDFTNRLYTTRFKRNPSIGDIGVINSVCEKLIQEYELTSLENKLLVLWLINCIVYAAVAGFIVVNNLKRLNIPSTVVKVNNKECRVPYAINNFDLQIKEARKLLSQVCAECNRLRTNGRLTRKSRRNRELILNHCESISINSLTCLIEKLKKRVTYLSKRRKLKLKSFKIRQVNNEFDKDQSKVFKKFKKCIDKDPDNMTPVFEECHTERKYFEDTDKVESFWKNLWELPDVGQPTAEWLEEIRIIFENIVPEIDRGDITFDSKICFKGIQKKKNWSAPGPDYIANFWWKKLLAVLDITSDTFRAMINIVGEIEEWYCRGRTALIPKDGVWSEDNQRPITCLNTQYKWFTSLLLYFHNLHLEKHQLMQIDQRGAKQNVSGTIDNILIDDMVLRDAILHRRNLLGFWVDVRKAFDSVSHSWLIEMFVIHRFPVKLIEIITNIVSKWSVIINIPVKDGNKQSGVIKISNGILQGDSFCPALYTLGKNVISWLVRSFEGYTLAKPISTKITHTLFIDDLKGYAKSRSRLIFCLNKICNAMKEAGLFWNPKKCKFFEISRGKHNVPENITLDDGTVIKSITDDETYKFMGVPQSYKNEINILEEKLLKLVKQRAHIIWNSDLYDMNKVYASNIFINSAVEYFFWAIKFTSKFLKDIDLAIRNAMNTSGAKHTNLMNAVVYLPRAKGGRGLKSFEQTYKEIKIKIATKLINTEDKRMLIVKQFHKSYFDKANYSIFKEANNYIKDMEFDFEIVKQDSKIYFKNVSDDQSVREVDVKKINSDMEKKRTEVNIAEILQSKWQGVNLKARMEDESINKSYFSWLKNWKSCPTSVVIEFFNLFYQTLPTLCYKQGRCATAIENTTCRLCLDNQESVMHLMSNCSKFLKTVYKSRHDNAFKCFVFPLLKKLGLIDKDKAWYTNDKVKPYYENESAKFWWDIPEYTGREDPKDKDSRPLRPDGKLELINENEHQIYLLEMSVPWISNREVKLKEKLDKYEHILIGYRLDFPDYVVEQITLIMDGFGGYDDDLVKNIGKVVKDKRLVDNIIRDMQKSVISSCGYLSRAFKVKTM